MERTVDLDAAARTQDKRPGGKPETLDIAADELRALGTRVWHEGAKAVAFEEVDPAV